MSPADVFAAVKEALESEGPLLDDLLSKGRGTVPGVLVDGKPLELTMDDVVTRVEAKPGFAAAGDGKMVVILDTTITQELREHGAARELIHRIQGIRKDMGVARSERVDVTVSGPGAERVGRHAAAVAKAVMCRGLEFRSERSAAAAGEGVEADLGPGVGTVTVDVSRA